jgi:hypothetical protein
MTTYRKISVLVPTRQRIDRLRTLIKSHRQTVEDPALSELVFRADDDDGSTVEFLATQDCSYIVGPRLKGYDSMPLFFNQLAAASSGDVLMCGNDDMVFRTVGWPRLVLKEANKYPDGLFNLGVMTLNQAHYPFSIVSRTVVNRLGFLWDPQIFWGDIFLRDTLSVFGRTFMLPTVQVDHDWAGNNPDRVFLEANKNITMRDPSYWSRTHLQAVNRAVEKLKGLQR